MTVLRPMQADSYPGYLEAAITGYARENVEAGRWSEVGALERSRDDFHSLLPAGIATPGNNLFEILEVEAGPIVGYVWYVIESKHGSCSAFIYDLLILEPYRRKGHARRALLALEQHAVALGAETMGLNVFVTNEGAQKLYRALGYTTTNLNMSKPLQA